ncbi:MAG: SDR family oxidoreductase [Bacteroidetes bacterium]|nr:SDR family oxidoreductase [Bacteroidota bacterium]
MDDKIVLVTGSTDGIGKQTAIDLCRLRAKVIVHGRNEQKAKETMEDIARQTGNQNLDYVKADLASMDQIRNMAEEIKSKYDRIDVLINNAGVFMNRRELSQDGFEMTFAVNHISYFLLTGLLLDLIKKSDYARIVNVASMAHASSLDFDNLNGEKYFEGYDAYSRSKLCNILFTYKLARMLKGTHVTINALHPGVISTKLLHKGFGGGGSTLSQGSETSVFLATSCEVGEISGKYFSNSRMVNSSKVSYDVSIQDELWNKCEEYIKMKSPE